MQRPGGRDNNCLKGQGVPHLEVSGQFSSSILDETDAEILALTEGNPMTVLGISEKMKLPFVECLLRTRELWRKSLLDRTDAEPDSTGLYRYSAAEVMSDAESP